MKIVIDDKIPFIRGALDRVARVIYLPGGKIGPAEVKDADALVIRTRTRCDRSLLEGSKVKFIATATIGFDHIDTAFCEQAGITWTNAPGCNSSSVEQYIVSTLLYLANMHGPAPEHGVLGIIGVGNVGSKVARAARALGYRVMLNDPPRAAVEGEKEFTRLEDLLGQSDIVTMHVPLTPDGPYRTTGMACQDFFAQMKEGAVFINSSRGEVVDEEALKMAIRSDRLSGAVLDVFRNEPKVDRELLSMVTLATPHIAGYSADGKANGTTMSVRALSRFFDLGLDEWQPENVPAPASPDLFADGGEADQLDLVSEIYAATYSVQEDHDRMMDHMDQFEKLRGNYRDRREPSAYTIRVFNDDGKYREIFEGLGFNVLADSCY